MASLRRLARANRANDINKTPSPQPLLAAAAPSSLAMLWSEADFDSEPSRSEEILFPPTRSPSPTIRRSSRLRKRPSVLCHKENGADDTTCDDSENDNDDDGTSFEFSFCQETDLCPASSASLAPISDISDKRDNDGAPAQKRVRFSGTPKLLEAVAFVSTHKSRVGSWDDAGFRKKFRMMKNRLSAFACRERRQQELEEV